MKDLLHLEQIDTSTFMAQSHQPSFRHSLFGGQVIAQALMAAGLTVDKRNVHSLHAYFLRPGNSEVPIYFHVETLLEGRSFTNKQVKAVQNEKTVLNMLCSFHVNERGYEHQPDAPHINKTPEQVRAEVNQPKNTGLLKEAKRIWASPIEVLPLNQKAWGEGASRTDTGQFWISANGAIPNTPLHHYCTLAFASDIGLLGTTLLKHDTSLFNGGVFPASVDHSIWFHREPNLNDWNFYHTESPWAGGARGLGKGEFFQQGKIIATIAQEGLIRPADVGSQK